MEELDSCNSHRNENWGNGFWDKKAGNKKERKIKKERKKERKEGRKKERKKREGGKKGGKEGGRKDEIWCPYEIPNNNHYWVEEVRHVIENEAAKASQSQRLGTLACHIREHSQGHWGLKKNNKNKWVSPWILEDRKDKAWTLKLGRTSLNFSKSIC